MCLGPIYRLEEVYMLCVRQGLCPVPNWRSLSGHYRRHGVWFVDVPILRHEGRSSEQIAGKYVETEHTSSVQRGDMTLIPTALPNQARNGWVYYSMTNADKAWFGLHWRRIQT